ncbi:MAG: hypothetical protein HQ559_15660 [Lentisphaerae bacterium]|nr:hypothetical protein [Lentisphaerota bacterium]
MSGRVDVVESDVATVSGRVDQVETDLGTISGRVDVVEADISTVSGRVDQVETDLGTVSGRVDVVETDVSTVSGRVDQVETDLGTVSGRVDVVETDMVKRDGTQPFTTNLVEVGSGMKFGNGDGGSNDFVWVGTSGTVFRVASTTDVAVEAAAGVAADAVVQATADNAADLADYNERRIGSLWGTAYGLTWDLPGGFGLSCTNPAEWDLAASSNYTVSASGTAWSYSIDDPPTAYFSFDEASGTALTDLTGGNDGLASNDVSTRTDTGIITNALKFENDVAHSVRVDGWQPSTGEGAFSVFYWFKSPNTDNAKEFYHIGWGAFNQADLANITCGLDYTTGHFIFQKGGSGSSNPRTTFDVDNGLWHMLGGTFDPVTDEAICWVNATNVAAKTWTGLNVTDNSLLNIGSFFGNKNATGTVDEVMFFDRVITPQEVTNMYNGGAPTGGSYPQAANGGNMRVQTTNALYTTESYTQTQGRVVLWFSDPDGDTVVNTDLVASVAWDGGSSFDTLTLTKESVFPSNTFVYSASTNWTGQGTQGVLRVDANAKDGNCDGTLEKALIFSRE